MKPHSTGDLGEASRDTSRDGSHDFASESFLEPNHFKGEEKMHYTTPKRSFRSALACVGVFLVAGYMVFAVVFLVRAKEGNRPSCSCGNSVEEAKSMLYSCKYDSVAAAWLPPACRDDENTAEFDLSGPEPDGSWPYYADWNKTQRITREEVGELADVKGANFYTVHEWHVMHCTFIWRKQWRVPVTGVVSCIPVIIFSLSN